MNFSSHFKFKKKYIIFVQAPSLSPFKDQGSFLAKYFFKLGTTDSTTVPNSFSSGCFLPHHN